MLSAKQAKCCRSAQAHDMRNGELGLQFEGIEDTYIAIVEVVVNETGESVSQLGK